MPNLTAWIWCLILRKEQRPQHPRRSQLFFGLSQSFSLVPGIEEPSEAGEAAVPLPFASFLRR